MLLFLHDDMIDAGGRYSEIHLLLLYLLTVSRSSSDSWNFVCLFVLGFFWVGGGGTFIQTWETHTPTT